MNNISMISRDKCKGCYACVASCPQYCISMEEDDLGFNYPIINKENCINCGICLSACKMTDCESNISVNSALYAAKNKSSQVMRNSSSGGVFTALTNIVLQKKGYVCGAVFDQKMNVVHIMSNKYEDRDRMRGSKYTYSNCTDEFFNAIRNKLIEGEIVLFSGTPCQVAALRSVLNKEYDNLITVDILCHGVESPRLYRDYIRMLSRKGEIRTIDFRTDRTNNWHMCKTLVYYLNGRTISSSFAQSYFDIFVNDYALRKACYTCQYASFRRVSDITIGDFWGIENTKHKDFDSKYGCSFVSVNSRKGSRLFESASSELEIIEVSKEDCTHKQLNGLERIEKDTDSFEQDYLKKGYKYIVKKYIKPPMKIRVKEVLYRNKCINLLRNRIKSAIEEI